MKRLRKRARMDAADLMYAAMEACVLHERTLREPLTAEEGTDILEGIVLTRDTLEQVRDILEAVAP